MHTRSSRHEKGRADEWIRQRGPRLINFRLRAPVSAKGNARSPAPEGKEERHVVHGPDIAGWPLSGQVPTTPPGRRIC